MPALVADIARAQRAAVIAEAEAPAIKALYDQARDGRTVPAKGFFDSAGDALTALGARMAIVGTVRRRFAVPVASMIFPDLSAGVPVWTLVDAEQDVNGPCLTARIELDAETETTNLELFG